MWANFWSQMNSIRRECQFLLSGLVSSETWRKMLLADVCIYHYWRWKSHCIQLFVTPWTTQSMEFSRPEYWSGLVFSSPWDLPKPGIEPRSPTLQADSLPVEPRGKPKKTGVGSLSLLQQIFPTQELNQGLLHCRWILYQLSYQESCYHHH